MQKIQLDIISKDVERLIGRCKWVGTGTWQEIDLPPRGGIEYDVRCYFVFFISTVGPQGCRVYCRGTLPARYHYILPTWRYQEETIYTMTMTGRMIIPKKIGELKW